MDFRSFAKRAWDFLWNEDSFASLIANILVAFVLIKYIVYPGMGLLLGTELPLVAVVSGSMHHDASFNPWWENAKPWYESNGIDYAEFSNYPLRNGFDKGDIMLITGATVDNLKAGDIIVFDSSKPNPIIHRVVNKYEENGKIYYQTKGDNYATNPESLKSPSLDETKIPIEAIEGKAMLRVPFVGYIKILAIQLVGMVS